MAQITKYILFQLKDEIYGVNVNQIKSIERLQDITRVPNSSDFVKGVISLRGEITVVIDLKERLNIDFTTYTDETRVLIVSLQNIQIGLIVDKATDVMDIDEKIIEPVSQFVGSVHPEYLRGIAKLENQLIVILNLESILNNEEINEIKDVKELTQ